MRTRHGIEFHKGREPDKYGPGITERGWYVRDDLKPGILRGPYETRALARQELARLRDESA